MNVVSNRMRRWFGAVLCAGIAAAGTVAIGTPATAYTKRKTSACPKITWSDSTPAPEYRIHIYEFFDGGGDVYDLIDLHAAVYDVMTQFNNVGGTSARVSLGTNPTDARAFESGTWFTDDTGPTIHIGFTDDPAEVDPDGLGIGSMKPNTADSADCEYDQVHLTFRDMSLQNWNFGTPGDAGEDYYTAEYTDAADAVYFRPVLLHELLHAFGLDHSNDTYAFTNYNQRPWAGGGRSESEAVRPLPDDVRGLRALYPGSGTRAEVALLNTWYQENSDPQKPADQFLLCRPSLGTGYFASHFNYPCGTGGADSGATEVCAGDRLYTKFAFANYSTETADNISLRLFFSTDETYHSTDPFSPTFPSITVDAAHSKLVPTVWRVPHGLVSGTEYHPIVRAIGSTASGAAVEDWIPLTGTVTAC